MNKLNPVSDVSSGKKVKYAREYFPFAGLTHSQASSNNPSMTIPEASQGTPLPPPLPPPLGGGTTAVSVRMDGSKNSQSLGSGDVHNLETVVVRGVSCVGNQEEGGKSSAGQNHGERCIQAYVNKRERERQTDKHPSIHPSIATHQEPSELVRLVEELAAKGRSRVLELGCRKKT